MLSEIRHSIRSLAKSPGFTFVAIASLAIGIGANSAIFSLADALLLRPLPVASPDDVVTVRGTSPSDSSSGISYRDYLDFRDRSKLFRGFLAYDEIMMGFGETRDELPRMRLGMIVSGNFFAVLGVQPALGRGFRPEEDQAPGRDRVVVLGHDTWKTQFGSDPAVIGRTVRLNGIEFTIIGVAPSEFTSLDQYTRTDFFVPAMMAEALGVGENGSVWERRNNRSFLVKGRLKAGVSLAEANAELKGIARQLELSYPDTNRNQSVAVLTELQARTEASPPDAALTWTLMGLVGLVLLVACSNVASLMLSRGRERAHEIAIRLAIGCSRLRLVRQLLTESLLLAAGGGAAGLSIAYAGVRFFSRIQLPTDLPVSISPKLDERVLGFALLASLASAVLFGLVPAVQASRVDVTPELGKAGDGGSRRRAWGRNILVASQVGISLVLMVAAMTLFRGFRELVVESPGFRTDHLLMMSFDPSLARYKEASTREFYKQLVERAQSAAGVTAAALTRVIPMSTNQYVRDVVPEGYEFPQGKETDAVFGNVVGDGYFSTLKVPIARGRALLATDLAGAPRVGVVNERFAEVYWPNQDPLGKRFRLGTKGDWVQVVGVAKNGKYLWIGEAPQPYFYLPLAQQPQSRMTLVAESAATSAGVAQSLRDVVRGIDPNLPVFDVRTIEDFFQMRAVSVPNMIVQTVGLMGIMGVVLAMGGLYAVTAYSVSRRTREIGIRMAIGADRRDVLRMVLRQGTILGGAGVAAGLVLSVASDRLLMAAFNAQGIDPVSYGFVAAGLLVVTMLAAFGPAWRASRVDPMRALRHE